MAIKYTSQKCDSCGSTKFDYLEKLNLWECAYCGNRIERQEQIDTMFTIKNVVRQVLVDVSYQRFSEAKNNLTECEKIDSRYVGTTIARICYLLNAAMYDINSQQEQRNMLAQIKKYYGVLCELGSDPSEEEYILYEFLDSAEAVGTLILVYDTLNAQNRLETVYSFFKPEEVYSLQLNSNLLRFMLNHQKYELADKIVSNYDNIEKKSALLLLLEQYPDTPQKVENCSLLLSQNVLTNDDKSIIEEYLNNSEDSVTTKYGIACAALATTCAPSVRCVMSSIVSKINNKEEVKQILDIVMKKKLVDAEVYTIVEYALEKCSQDVTLYILERLKDTNQFVVLTQQHFILLLDNVAVNYEYKKKIIDTAISFNVNDKTKEQFISYYLNNVRAEAKKRKEFLEYLFKLVPSLSTVSVEKYILSCSLDGEIKPDIVKMIFAMNINKAFFRETFDKYIVSNSDSKNVSDKMIDVLAEQGLKISEGTLVNLLISPAYQEEKKLDVLRKVKNSGVVYLSVLDKYLVTVGINSFSEIIFQELIDYSDSVSAEAFVKYLLNIKDADALKPINAVKLSQKCKLPVLTQIYQVNHLNTLVECSVLQAYVLVSPDAPMVTSSVLNSLGAHQVKLNTDIHVSGIRKKYKKYLISVRGQLSEASLTASRELGLL